MHYEGEFLEQQKKVCFFGDSQTRNNVYWMVSGCSALKKVEIQRCAGTIKYFPTRYGQDFLSLQRVWQNETRCPFVFINFGQWDLGWPGENMTAYEDYQEQVQRSLETYVRIRGNFSLVWMTTNPHPIPRRCKKEWRFLNHIEEYNRRALVVSRNLGVSVWDTYSILKHVYDRDYDGAHYRYPDAVMPSFMRLLAAKTTLLSRT